MKGLLLAKAYYEEYGEAMLERFPEQSGRIAAGLAGHGSECYGFDDALSRDHDYGPGFCLWLYAGDYKTIGGELQKAYESLPGSYLGFPPRNVTPRGANRVGVLEIGAFYREFTGRTDAPVTPVEWLRIPEEGLAAATNGVVFRDPGGAFTAVRERLLAYYPEDVRLVKIAARAAGMAQAGQYNYARCMRRGEQVAARLSLDEFVRQTMAMCYLLCRVFMPFYKWAYRGLLALPIHARIREGLAALAETGVCTENAAAIEEICRIIREELTRQHLTHGEEDFLETHAWRITERITDPGMREQIIMKG
ncbi:MAG: DUF4037 domain-containing protein [Treponema sp.]|nr:DUF4037 domain-containing protein [Treponema sp.]